MAWKLNFKHSEPYYTIFVIPGKYTLVFGNIGLFNDLSAWGKIERQFNRGLLTYGKGS